MVVCLGVVARLVLWGAGLVCVLACAEDCSRFSDLTASRDPAVDCLPAGVADLVAVDGRWAAVDLEETWLLLRVLRCAISCFDCADCLLSTDLVGRSGCSLV